ncbi:MAG: hypothetical protein RML34_09155 [Leptospiraceae bacterium]|nr:hypothetical protein [Leptospiraceae bacterium]
MLVILPRWQKYRDYMYFENFLNELFSAFWRYLNICLTLTFFSGATLMGFSGKNAWEGYFGIFFSAKMLLLAALFFLIWPYLRPVGDFSDIGRFYRSRLYRYFLFLTAALLITLSVSLRIY